MRLVSLTSEAGAENAETWEIAPRFGDNPQTVSESHFLATESHGLKRGLLKLRSERASKPGAHLNFISVLFPSIF